MKFLCLVYEDPKAMQQMPKAKLDNVIAAGEDQEHDRRLLCDPGQRPARGDQSCLAHPGLGSAASRSGRSTNIVEGRRPIHES